MRGYSINNKNSSVYYSTLYFHFIFQVYYQFYKIKSTSIKFTAHMKLTTARLARVNNYLQWDRKHNGVFIRIPIDQSYMHLLFYVHNKLSFKHLLIGLNLSQDRITFPQGMTVQSNILQFLFDQTIPKTVQLILSGNQKRVLRNKACDKEAKIVEQVAKAPDSIYGYLNKYLDSVNVTNFGSKYSSSVNYFLNQFYMRLTAQTYCKINKISPNAIIDQELKNKILNYIGEQYQNDSPAAIKRTEDDKQKVIFKINKLKQQIHKLQADNMKMINIYKYGAVLVTFAHIISFGYMIFFVDWLGWDIVEPLTYSVGVFYTLLGIRFYRKHRTDRTNNSIQQILVKMIIHPAKLAQIKDLYIRKALLQAQLRRVEARSLLLTNRINFRSSLADAFNKQTTLLTS